jgi:hypothetical protein
MMVKETIPGAISHRTQEMLNNYYWPATVIAYRLQQDSLNLLDLY